MRLGQSFGEKLRLPPRLCSRLCVSLLYCKNTKVSAMEKDFLHLIETRRSCRSYRPEQIADEQLEAILQAGTYAPSAMGAQSPYIVAVQNPGQIAQLSAMNARVMNTSADPYYGAPTLVLVFAPREAKNAVQDDSCVLENMMLAAHALGVGSCWINREREMFATEEGVALMKQWGLPEGLCGVGALSLGYPAAEPSPRKPRKEDYVRVIR